MFPPSHPPHPLPLSLTLTQGRARSLYLLPSRSDKNTRAFEHQSMDGNSPVGRGAVPNAQSRTRASPWRLCALCTDVNRCSPGLYLISGPTALPLRAGGDVCHTDGSAHPCARMVGRVEDVFISLSQTGMEKKKATGTHHFRIEWLPVLRQPLHVCELHPRVR